MPTDMYSTFNFKDHSWPFPAYSVSCHALKTQYMMVHLCDCNVLMVCVLYARTCARVCVCVDSCMCVCIHVWVCGCVHSCMHVCIVKSYRFKSKLKHLKNKPYTAVSQVSIATGPVDHYGSENTSE